ncbi:MAG: MerR family transcriptional regulator [Pseudomonadota bacterium]
MKKSPQAFRTISEVSETIDVPAHVLRFWESRFTQIRPVKRGGGRRYYRPEDISLLTAIRELLYTEGFTIRGVQKLLKETSVKSLIEKYSAADGSDGAPATETTDSDLWNDVPPEGLAEMPEPEPAAKPKRDPAKVAAMRSVLTRLEALRDKMIAEGEK